MAASEQKKSYAVIKSFKGLNTKANRTAIETEEFSWIENVQPVGYGNLRVVPGQTTIKTGAFSNTVSYLTSFNINNTEYIFAAESNGAAQYCTPAGTTGNVASSGTFSSSGVTATQFNNQYALIGDPNNGLFSWDGANLVSIGSVGVIGITNPGAGYITAPTVTISAPNQTGGVQATAVSTITTGASGISYITLSSGGSGYTSVPSVTISAPTVSGGVQAVAYATIQANAVVAITLSNPGSGYLSPPTITISGVGSGANATAVLNTGTVNTITITNGGSGYTSPPTITMAQPVVFTGNCSISGTTLTINSTSTGAMQVGATLSGTGVTAGTTIVSGSGSSWVVSVSQTVSSTIITASNGTAATAICQLSTFKTGTVAIAVTGGGAGYGANGSFPVTITGGNGANAAATAIVSGGAVTQVIMTNPGTGYTTPPTISFAQGQGANATGVVVLNSNPIVDVASFSGRVWVAQGRTVTYSSSVSFSDFTSVSAGSLTLTGSTLTGNINSLLSANNFLYIFGPDSINVFSNLQVTSAGTTVFTNTNVSASIGTQLSYAVFPYFRSVLLMNNYGVYSLVGSTTSKISDPLDNIFPYIDFTNYQVSGGQVIINNLLCAAFNFWYTGGQGYSNSPRFIQAVFFEKKWFLSSQGSLTFVTSAPYQGKINLYGTDGTNLYQLYASQSVNVPMYVQTALQPMQDAIRTKQALKFAIEATITNATSLMVTVDSETGSSPTYTLNNYDNWTNNSGTTIAWVNNSSQVVAWTFSAGYALYKSDAQQYGKYLGLTLTANSSPFTVNTFEFEHELRVRF